MAHPTAPRDWCSAGGAGLRIAVQVMPNAAKSEVAGETEGALKVRLKAPPVEGKANEALVRFVADRLGVPKSRVSVTHGHTSRQKLLDIDSAMPPAEAKAALLRG